MKTVKFNSNAAGSYGMAYTGDEKTLTNSVADALEKAGIVEVIGDAGDDAEESSTKEGSVRFSDETGKEKMQRTEVEDPADPTNEAKNKEKKSTAGPNAKK